MTNLKKFLLPLVYLLTFSAAIVAQSPWVRSKGNAYVQLGLSTVTYNMVSIDKQVVETGNFSYDLTSQLYAEYGIPWKTEFSLVVPYKFVGYNNSSNGSNANLNGAGNLQFGMKRTLLDKQNKLSVGLIANLNTVKQLSLAGLRTGFKANTILPYLTYGGSNSKYYYFGMFGYGAMDNGYADYIKMAGEIGKQIKKDWLLIFIVELRKSVSSGTFGLNDDVSFSKTALYRDNQQFLTFGLKANYEFIPSLAGATLSFFGAAYVRNVAAGPAVNISIYRKFN